MNTWKDAWMIMKKDLSSEKRYLVWSVIFALYMGGMIGFVLIGHDEAGMILDPVADFLFILMFPMLGFYFSRRSFKYLTDDSYTQMLAYFRVLPISYPVILSYRFMQALFAFAVNGVIFFLALYLISGSFHAMPIDSYIAFAITWIAYGMMMTGPYVYMEFSNHGKAYFCSSFVFMGSAIIAAVIIKISGGNLVLYTVEASSKWGLLSPVMWGALAAGIISMIVFSKGVLRKLRTRDLV